MSPKDIKAARDLIAAATPGPWDTERRGDGGYLVEVNDTTGWKKDYPNLYIAEFGGWGYSGPGNGKFIAAARTLLPAALDEIERLKKDPRLYTSEIELENISMRIEIKKLRAIAAAAERMHKRLLHAKIGELIYGMGESSSNDKSLFETMELAIKEWRASCPTNGS